MEDQKPKHGPELCDQITAEIDSALADNAAQMALFGLARFVVRMCRCMHEEWDNAYAPPPKPDRDVIVAYNRGQLPIDKSEHCDTMIVLCNI